jgi:hypothetical protein
MSVSKWEMKNYSIYQLKRYMRQLKDLIYASENLAALPLTKEEQQKSCIGTLGKAYLYQDNFAKAATTLESVITAGIISVADYN